ncbi:MAG: HEAT repeat domain-containing protein [Microcoleus sp. PH2017_29_MFU_D_A]|nr:HEAT repeat domain-containing protein [Microcoleus sp. PH2017_01_SCD_O_A]MCC3428810.1 HEAT repeat domain-containing protein [Microcoleus sp. PH2017_04_SCI_O_A]MCC3456375.1 HEAT repeat domain-containing protein [Microcoleus sp. PH2017_08_TRC_O_A]MCC3607723.1 HEAT repeat domain-containing protein [Microcoleus sp. PH2017_29_MFU_D_A]MCC3638813.1 HEAT repeat domain-containing protein [Microcoleus sp. PH2017_37_MFU_D_B]TAG68802.1 MAG: HEAT repeat domain-containing protein [Oscillatoriales cyanoba
MIDPIIKNLLEDCCSNDPSKQIPAIMELKDLELEDIEIQETCATLIELLHSPENNVKELTVEVLGWIGDQEIETVGPALMKMLVDPENLVRAEAVDSLSLLSYKKAKDAISFILCNDPDWIVRASAAEALSHIADVGDATIFEALQLALEDSYEPVRSYAAFSIGVLGTLEMIPTLPKYLESEDSLDTKAAILAAQYILSEPNALFTLLKLVEKADQQLGGVILNIFGDLAYRKIPRRLAEDSATICKSLVRIGQDFFVERYHAEQVIAQLKNLPT